MSNTSEASEPVERTIKSLKTIREELAPFLKILQEEHNRDSFGSNEPSPVDPQQLAEAEAAVALTLGTLRYISSRLSGKKVDAGLKMELDKMKKVVVRLMKKKKQIKVKSDN